MTIRLTWLLLSALLASPLSGDEPAPTPSPLEEIANKQPPFLVAAEVNRASREYREGDSLSLRVASEQDAFLYVYYQQADGKVFQIFPNRHRPNNQVKARQAVQIPDSDELWTWQVGKPFGKETIKVVASRQKLENSFQPKFEKSDHFIRLTTQDVKGIELELGEEEPAQWAESDIKITTYPDDQPPATVASKRVGLFIGVSKHHWSQQTIAQQVGGFLAEKEIKANGVTDSAEKEKILEKYYEEYRFEELNSDLAACHRDAQKLAKAMDEYGRLSDYKLLTNDDATKANIEKMFTQWLPSVTHPGDTVVLHLSLHTGQMDDESGEEPDKLDEFFVPHDTLCLTAEHNNKLLQFLKSLTEEEQKQFGYVIQLLNAAGPYFQKHQGQAPLAMLQETCVTDDLLARWLQHISGRQILLVADTCHSAGYADTKTGIDQSKPRVKALPNLAALRTNYFDNEMSRLRAMGQKEQAILAACQLEQSAQERAEKDFGVMTGAIVEILQSTPGKITLDDGFKTIQTEMKKYFDAHTDLTPSQPFLLNHCTRPLLLKL